ncbi:uncharacterized protein LOC127010880 [Drosophila biarmipes]|uniref:uncharacterized protein LOC127010880 n=1 Tax=Drosophila biarmipes TaxID=125945 RepID=UPI0021CC684C|nr:uncharacterized protein LOC127010880 [Drosophila biarmipes]
MNLGCTARCSLVEVSLKTTVDEMEERRWTQPMCAPLTMRSISGYRISDCAGDPEAKDEVKVAQVERKGAGVKKQLREPNSCVHSKRFSIQQCNNLSFFRFSSCSTL